MQLSIKGLERGGGSYWKSLACLWSKLKQYYPPTTDTSRLVVLILLIVVITLIFRPVLLWNRRLWIPAEAAYCSSPKALRSAAAPTKTNGWTLMRHSLKYLIWSDSAPKFIHSQLCLLQRESGKLTGWWMRKMSGLDRKTETWTSLTRSGLSGEPGRMVSAESCPQLNCPPHAQAAFWLIGPLSDIDCLGVMIERQIRGKVGSGHDRKCAELLCFYFQY